MYWTHHFARRATLERARYWLTQLGLTPDQIETHPDGVPRLVLSVDPAQVPGIEKLIHAVERTDPEGWPSFWQVARQLRVYRPEGEESSPAGPAPRHPAPIGWHPPDSADATAPERRTIQETFDRWAWWQITSR